MWLPGSFKSYAMGKTALNKVSFYKKPQYRMEFKEFGERGGESGNKQLLKSPGKFKKIKHIMEIKDKSHLSHWEVQRAGCCFSKDLLNTY